MPTIPPTKIPSSSPSNSQVFTIHPTEPSQLVQYLPTTLPSSDTSSYLPTISNSKTCNDDQVKIEIQFMTDSYGDEITWHLVNLCIGQILLKSGAVLLSNHIYNIDKCLPKNQAYSFVMKDNYGDGMCCDYGQGWYTVAIDGRIVKNEGGVFSHSEDVTFGSCDEILSSKPSGVPHNFPNTLAPMPTSERS
eukprot:CAMPEP_0172504828 /NCGR_PEP_ID=MMETSP1066-20121228/181658_1 /TAXON_ID=671091 /ORGANISM="Coscinodiscus wailesii, Strain CCMP2513" /LENGTH=190 /DNA_ID=CAMNT_0013281185 /DNA_START=17 /DNA_END=589 /DNA_ORIENTATION=+